MRGSRRRHLFWTTGAIFGITVVGVALWIYFQPPQPDPLCSYVRGMSLDCPTLASDPGTLRPGAITRHVSDQQVKGAFRVELPSSYLDNETCLIPGVRLTPLNPTPQPFSLRSIIYKADAVASLNGQLAQGISVSGRGGGTNVSEVRLDFGEATTYLLDENLLIERIERCEIRPACVQRILDQKYRVVNRVPQVKEMSYRFVDSRGIEISAKELLEKGVLRLDGSIGANAAVGETLNSKMPLVIALQLINETAVQKAKPCTAPVLYSVEGSGLAQVGGGGRPGHIVAPPRVFSKLGEEARASAVGSENTRGDRDRTQSRATATAVVRKGQGDGQLQVLSSVDVQGGHYGRSGVLGLGVASGHDTGANATATADGRINVLLRSSRANLRLTWSGLPQRVNAGGSSISTELVLVGPSGQSIQVFEREGPDGTAMVALEGEGQYAVTVKVFARAEASGSAGRARHSVNAMVRAMIEAPQ
jgi:hypothetical protein